MPDQGNIVYGAYTQPQLDAQYDQTTLVPDLAPYVRHWRAASEKARQSLPCRLDVAYGPHPRQAMDIFPAGGQATGNAPVIVHVHGGAWRREDKENANFPASAYVSRGAAFIAIDFALATEVTLDEMVSQVRTAIGWVYANAASFGGDRERIYISGHSSGAHLAAMTLAGDWRKRAGLPEDVIKGALLVSGLYDLAPVRLSSRNEYLHLDEAAAHRNSPILHIPPVAPPVIIAWGERELDEFRRQSADFALKWREAGHSAETVILPGKNHFDTSNVMADVRESPVRRMLALMGLAQK